MLTFYILLLLTAVLSGVVGYMIANYRIEKSAKNSSRKAVNHQQSQIMKLFETLSEVTNDDVQALLGVSDATSTRYLQGLKDQGQLKQHGSGRGIYYTKP